MKENLKKVCARCSKELPLHQFDPHPSRRSGRVSLCRECAKTQRPWVGANEVMTMDRHIVYLDGESGLRE